ncbi:DnaB-like helicase C-terminal domain-containing protein [Metabacillus fastidiosus]|uniref:DnaB-like helicase C-terminal domain-containing protein n=1 Tax=Metabacillus fastidiosus TaxID=1458 RepID=UPI002E1AEF68|nr:DnaB-like helicase C-terminal domain-containing protein [Metabacillus fastidiosus]MED4456179.1 DnaB-like helicase C-terminal domain-containing protein [Metabacillus fastidiosus]
MNADQLKKEVSVVDVLDKYLGVHLPMRGTKSRNIPCPIHGGKNDNFAVDTEKGIATCFSKCGKTWNAIDLTMEIHKVDFKGAIGLLEKDFLLESNNNSKLNKEASVSVPAPTNAKKNYKNLYTTLSHDDYFLNRGLSKEIIDKYRLGSITDQSDLNGFAEEEKNFLKNAFRFIIPITDHFFISRLDESKFTTQSDEPEISRKFKYRNFGETQLLNKSYIGDTSKNFIFVVEGAFDALTIETLGYKAIALNSAANASLLVKEIQSKEEQARQQQFILLADNDEAGKKLEEKLQESFKKMNMSIHVAKLDDSFKDINELAINNPDRAEAILHTAIDDCINANSAFHILYDFFTNMKRVEPIQIKEFPKLNEVIGGLRSALYVVGAASSLGKTTFIQEIADSVAKNDNHVLFFSLEMGKKELVAKSLVRTMGELKSKQKIKGELTYTRDLLSGDIKNHNLLMNAVGEYEKIAKNLFIYEGMFNINVYTIWQEVEKHIRLHKKNPLVIVDYLQILEPINDRMSEKQATDKNVTELKRMTRELDVPLIAISSFNRDSYNKEASFSSFKESGSIEYGSDVVLALELQKIKDLDKDANGKAKEAEKLNEAKGSLIRDINLKVLKNRFGKAFEEIRYNYFTNTNKFEEVDINKQIVVQSRKKI